ncbi:MAG: hypothetical protein LC132_05285 [Burkholderiales bacterium]|nr:hypothetical protein [Burkholderiales bacterium]
MMVYLPPGDWFGGIYEFHELFESGDIESVTVLKIPPHLPYTGQGANVSNITSTKGKAWRSPSRAVWISYFAVNNYPLVSEEEGSLAGILAQLRYRQSCTMAEIRFPGQLCGCHD